MIAGLMLTLWFLFVLQAVDPKTIEKTGEGARQTRLQNRTSVLAFIGPILCTLSYFFWVWIPLLPALFCISIAVAVFNTPGDGWREVFWRR